MPSFSAFLKLVLPLYGEFVDSWDQVIDQNFEQLDDHLADLRRALLTGLPGALPSADYAALRGSQPNLASRLNVSINPDGTLNLDGSPAIAALGSSSTNGDQYFASSGPSRSPRLRFDFSDLEVWNARSPVPAARFSWLPADRGLLDDGLALRTRLRASGLVDGPEGFLSGVGSQGVKFDATLGSPDTWPLFNIDGYPFRIRQAVILDLSTDAAGVALSAGDIVCLFVSRVDYGSSQVKLATDPGAPSNRDLRRPQFGSDGVISGKTFSSVSANFQGSATQWAVIPGDLLVIDAGAAAGSYVIGAVPQPGSVTIVGTFKADGLAGVSWHIEDDAHPHIGCIKVADATSDPPAAPGRVYIGRGQLAAGGLGPVGGGPLTKLAFAKNGIYDSGWINVSTSSLPMAFEHNLGALPGSVEVWVRDSPAGEAFPPTSLRSFVADFDTTSTTVTPASAKKTNLRVPSMYWHSTRQRTQVHLSASAPNAAAELFTKDDDASHVTTGQIRLVARR